MYLPTFAADLARRRRRLEPGRPILLCAADGQREAVAACCAAALRSGVRPGMSVSHARALLPGGVHAEEHDAARVGRSLVRLAEWALRLAPIVAPDPPDGLRIDAGGCERLYRGIEPLLALLRGGAARLGLACRIAGAPSFGAAWGIARFGEHRVWLTAQADLRATLSPLPVEALRIEPKVAEALREVGCASIGDLLRLPRPVLPARYGNGLLRRLDQALGALPEPVNPVRPREPIVRRRVFDGPTDRLEAVLLATRELVEQAAAMLAGSQSGCRALRVELDRSDLPPEVLTLRTARPTHDAGHLWALVRPLMEKANLGFGVEGIAVRPGGVVRVRFEQGAWDEDVQDAALEAGAARLVDTMVGRLGERGVLRYASVASHVPERSFIARPVQSLDHVRGAPVQLADADRPSLLHTRPIPVEAVLLQPEGPLAAVLTGGCSLGVLSCRGPERIEAEWWKGEGGARDYYKVHTDDGRWLWLFRRLTDGRWFIHGEWA